MTVDRLTLVLVYAWAMRAPENYVTHFWLCYLKADHIKSLTQQRTA